MNTPINPYVIGNPVGDSSVFVGRDDVIDRVLSFLEDKEQNALTLYGQRRIGKTSVLQYAVATLPKIGPYILILFDVQDKVSWNLGRIIHELMRHIASSLGMADESIVPISASEFKNNWLPSALDKLDTSKSLVLLIDELDTLSDATDLNLSADFFTFLRELRDLRLQRLKFIFVLGRSVNDLRSIAYSLLKEIPKEQVSLLSKENTFNLVRLSERNSSLFWDDAALETIWQATSGQPFLTQKICSQIWHFCRDDDDRTILRVDSDIARHVILEIINWENDLLHIFDWTWQTLAPTEKLIVALLASSDVDKDQLKSILGETQTTPTAREIENAINRLTDWDLIELSNEQIKFRVPLFRTWVNKNHDFDRVKSEVSRDHPTVDSIYQTAKILFDLNKNSLNREKNVLVETLLRQALELHPRHRDSTELLSQILFGQKRYEDLRVLADNFDNPKPRFVSSLIINSYFEQLAATKDIEAQQAIYTRILLLDPENQIAEQGIAEIKRIKSFTKEPKINPYIAGIPVGNTSAFVGRENVLKEVNRVLNSPNQNALVLYGQRRAGKTSLLLHLYYSINNGDNFKAIYFDLQDKASRPLDQILFDLAIKINDQLKNLNLNTIPTENNGNFSTYFRENFLPRALNSLSTNMGIVLLFDEFDVVADPGIGQGITEFFPYLRSIISSQEKRLKFIFAIGRNLGDLTSVALSIFKGAPSYRISHLTRVETESIINLSAHNKSLLWSDGAIERVWSLTKGHAYLTQALCSQIWETVYDENPEKLPLITPNDVDNCIQLALSSSRNALEWLWMGLGPAEKVVAAALASAGEKMVSDDDLQKILLESGVRILIRELQDAPKLLQNWDILEPLDGGYAFRVELFRRWIIENRPLKRVQQELDRIQPMAESLYNAAKAFYENADLEQAESLLRQTIGINPNHIRAQELLSEILISNNDTSGALEILERLFQIAPSLARPRLIQVYFAEVDKTDDIKAKRAWAERLAQIAPQNTEVLSLLTKLQGIEKEQQEIENQFSRGMDAYLKRDWAIAIESFQWVVSHRVNFESKGQKAVELLSKTIKESERLSIWERIRRFAGFGK